MKNRKETVFFHFFFFIESLCWPMLWSVFSHKHFLHLSLNMYVLWSFSGIAIQKLLGTDQVIINNIRFLK